MDSIYLPLHHGKAPQWLLSRMRKLAKPLLLLIVDEFGENELIKRLSDPVFFQSLSNVLGFDWNSSGSTTVLTGVLKSVLNTEDFNVRIAGGKGKNALNTIHEIEMLSEEIGIRGKNMEELVKASRLSAKIDSTVLQDGYSLYHHCMIFTDRNWVVVQQGMNEDIRLARRYHHMGKISVEEPHSGIMTQRLENSVIDLTSRESRDARETILDVVNDGTYRFDFSKILSMKVYRESMIPRKVDWKALEKAYNLQPENFEELILIKGIGRSALRALALISELVYDAEYSKKDPAKFSFALGGKDGVPFPVNRETYEEVISFMESAIRQAEISDFERKGMLKKLFRLTPPRNKNHQE